MEACILYGFEDNVEYVRILKFSEMPDKDEWVIKIRTCDWNAAKFLADLLEQNRFHEIENQKNADYKLEIFSKLPIKHKCITAQPLLECINIEKYFDGIELVVVGGESDYNARPLDYSWVLDIREQSIRKNISFEFR